MKAIGVLAALILLTGTTRADSTHPTISFMFKEAEQVWCGYADRAAFDAEAEQLVPLESARLSFTSDGIREVTYQLQPESGDWMQIDRYTPGPSGLSLMRTIILAESGVSLIQEGIVGPTGAFSISKENAQKPDGSPANKVALEMPESTIKPVSEMGQFPFAALAKTMRQNAIGQLCEVPAPR